MKLLVVVDYQKDFIDGALGFDQAKEIEKHIVSLIDEYHQNGDEVLFTFDTHHENYLKTQEGTNLPVVHCIENSEGWKLYGDVAKAYKEGDKCINKPGFGSLELGKYLEGKDYESIVFTGIVSHICVVSNAVIAKAALPEVKIYIDSKGIAGSDETLHEKTLDVLKNLQFEVI